MVLEALVVSAFLAAQPPALPDQLVISVVVTDKKGKPIADLAAAEVTVKEGSASQPVTRLEPDTRPLDVALVLDSSGNIGTTFASDVVPAVLEFLKRLPEGARYAIDTQLRRAIDLLASQYRLSWKPQTDPRQTKIEIKVSRKDARIIQAQRLATAW